MNLKVGMEIQFPAISREQIKDYAAASGDFNPIHLDANFAKAAGFSDVIAHGMLSMGLVSAALKDWRIFPAQISNFETKFKDVVQLGDQLKARISNLSPAEIEIQLVNQADKEVCSSRLTFKLK